ncbi:PREDICTED: putative POM121-like protein 1 [Chinchilla lanigera]|uniref:putative POM121-like protein 1 n=1 Tax=Chinchilla lanigera TaxID=34839 RepID=UPI00069922CA|nr:PREDICTED: putative POM121-like protein 1 [Chinchilla lanigera]
MEQQAEQRRGADGPGGLPSAFRPVVGRRGLIPYVPRPGPLPRNLHRQRSRDEAAPCPQASGVSSGGRNAIASSYSSTGGLPGQRRRALAAARTRPPRKAAKDPREHSSQTPSSHPGKPQKAGKENVADIPSREAEERKVFLPAAEGAGPGKRKIPLLRPRQGALLILPPPPKLSYKVTAEHIAREKEAAFQLVSRALMGKSQAPKGGNTTQPAHSPCLPAPGTAPAATIPAGKSNDRMSEAPGESDSTQPAGSPCPPVPGTAPPTVPAGKHKNRKSQVPRESDTTQPAHSPCLPAPGTAPAATIPAGKNNNKKEQDSKVSGPPSTCCCGPSVHTGPRRKHTSTAPLPSSQASSSPQPYPQALLPSQRQKVG